METDKLYSVSFCIYLDGDIKFNDWHNLNCNHRITKDIKLARRMILDHLRYAYESIDTNLNWQANIKDKLESIYLEYKAIKGEWFDIIEEISDDKWVEYHIREAKWLEEI